ncbi:MAG TPA: biotin/lipoyl-containing protein [Polyangiaceae bacterium]|nr:biotin/lipoyl-containing protein [Polyangiaceae bacterium]
MTRRYFVTQGERERSAVVEETGPARFRVRLDGAAEPVEVTVLGRGSATTVSADGRVVTLFRAASGEVVAGRTRASAVVSSRGKGAARHGASAGDSGAVLVSPMPGRVLKVLVTEGTRVEAGAPLVVVEAMKMENELVAARAGVVKRVLARAGDTVDRDAPLLEIE